MNDQIPTSQTIIDAGTNAEVFNEVVTSSATETTKTDSVGKKHLTLAGIEAFATNGYKGEWTPETDVEIGGIYGYQGSEWRSLTGADVEPVEGGDWRSMDDHNSLTNRDDLECHPARAISMDSGLSLDEHLNNVGFDVPTVSQLRSVNWLNASDIVRCHGYNELGDCPVRGHVVKTVSQHRIDIDNPTWQPNVRLDIALNSKVPPLLDGDLVAVYKSIDGSITYKQCGYNPDDSSQDSTARAVGEGAVRDSLTIIFDGQYGPLVNTNNQFDYGGLTLDLKGGSYRFSPANVGKIHNGFAILRDTWKNGVPNTTVSKTRSVDAVYRSTPPVLGPKKRFPVEISESDVSLGGKIFTWRKCDGSDYWVFEQIVTQQPSGVGTSIDNLCPAWRLGTLSMCDFVQAYIYTPSVIAAGDSEFTMSNPGSGNQERNIKYRQTSQPFAFYEYEVKKPSNQIGILLRTATSGCPDILAEVIDSDGNVVNQRSFSNVSSVSNNLKLVYIDSCVSGEDVTLRLTQNTSSSVFMSIAGVGCVLDDEVTASNVDYITYSAYTTGDNKVRSFFSGAMSYAIMEGNLLKFGGESHGGEVMSKQEIYIDGELFTPTSGDVFAARELRIEQESRTTFPSSAHFDTRSRHKFYSYPAAHDFDASHSFSDGFTARIAYGPMLTTHSEMDKMVLPEVIDASMDGFSGYDERYELGKTEYVRIESSVNPFVNEMWMTSYDGNYNESTPWWKIGKNANDSRKFYYGPVSSSSCGEKDLSKQPYATRSVRVYN